MKKNLLSTALLFFILQLISFLSFSQWNNDKSVNNPVVVNQGNQVYHVSCSDAAGGAIIAYYDNRGSSNNIFYNVYVQRLSNNGQLLWQAGGVPIGVMTTGVGDINIVQDGNGGAVVTFIVGFGSTLDIMAQRIDANGNMLWNSENPLIVCNAFEAQYSPEIANTGDGFVITWEDKRSGEGDIYAQKISHNGVIQWANNGVVVNAATANQYTPQLISIGNGEVMVTWQDQRAGINDVYCQKLNAAGVRQWRGVDNLLSGRIICVATGNQISPKICGDGSTGAIIAWQDYRMGTATNGDIYAQRIDSSGSVQWAANGVVLCNTITVQQIADIVFSGDGAVVCWSDFPSGNTGNEFGFYNIYAQKISTSGASLWGDDGVAVCDTTGLQNLSQVAADGSGGAIFTWIDERDGGLTYTKVYGQRINSNGLAAWTDNGVVVCSNTNYDRGRPTLVTDGCTAIFIWEDQRNSCCSILDNDIYATKLDCTGNVPGAVAALIWVGSVSSDWATAGNWSGNVVPTISHEVVIPAGTPFSPVLDNGLQAVCKNLKVENGAVITVATGSHLGVAE